MFSSGWKIIVVLSVLTFLQPPKCDGFVEIGTMSAVFQTAGPCNYMEDTFIRIENSAGTEIGIYAIFDGHSGDYSSNFSRAYFTDSIGHELKLYASNCCSYVEEPNGKLNFERMLKVYIEEAEAHLENRIIDHRLRRSGTTCLIAIVEENRLTVANVGDSRGVMCCASDLAIDLSIDHKPNSDGEKERIEEAGGKIHESCPGTWRVRGLAMSRSLGDHNKKRNDNIIIATPDLFTYDLDKHQPKFMILASDGLWDVMSSQAAVDFIKIRYLHCKDFGAMELAYRALHLESKDNITVLIVVFKNGRYEVGSASV